MAEKFQILFQSRRTLILNLLSIIVSIPPIITIVLLKRGYSTLIGEFSSEFKFWLFASVLFLISCTMLFVMLWLSGRYVLKIEKLRTDVVGITTWNWIFWSKTFEDNSSILSNIRYEDGELIIPGAPVVKAPWMRIKSSSGKTLVLDMQSEINRVK